MNCHHQNNRVIISNTRLPTRFSILLQSTSQSLKSSPLKLSNQNPNRSLMRRKKSSESTGRTQSTSHRSTILISSSVKKLLGDSIHRSKQRESVAVSLLDEQKQNEKQIFDKMLMNKLLTMRLNELKTGRSTDEGQKKILNYCSFQDNRMLGMNVECDLFKNKMKCSGHYNRNKVCKLNK